MTKIIYSHKKKEYNDTLQARGLGAEPLTL